MPHFEKPKFTTDQLKEIVEIIERKEEKIEGIEQARSSMEQKLNSRFKEYGSKLEFKLSSPEIPENLTEKHIEALDNIFGKNNLEPMIIPKLEELHNLNEEYQRIMYPETQTDQDKKKGLISYRPSWWKDKAEISGFNFQGETWGNSYIRSMKQELQELGNSLILVESIQKPDYNKDGKQQYGTKQGTDSSKDPLLPVFQQVLGQDKNRFNHSWDDLNNKLLFNLKEKIQEQFKQKNLKIPDFQVILGPATAFNLQTSLFNPENSQTNTWEWTSTILKDKDNKDSGPRLSVGDSEDGGASGVGCGRRGDSWGRRGARLAVVFKKK